MAHTYSHLYGIPATGLRFFTVYGPWGRPDMAYFSFTKNILNNQPIQLYNNGNLKRDFTFVLDIVNAIDCLIDKGSTINNKDVPHQVMNIGNQHPIELKIFVATLEKLLQKKAIIDYFPMQPGDVLITYADTSPLQKITGMEPSTSLEEGLHQFVQWYKSYFSE